MPLYLAIDQSTSASKALLFDSNGEAVDRESKEHRQIYPRPGWVEHDAEEIWQNCLEVVDTLISRQADLSQIRCVSITNQRETVVVFDRATGKPLCNAMVWQCRRGVALCEQSCSEGYDAMVGAKTGLKIDAYFSASKLKCLMRNEPGIADKIRKGEALVGTVDAYLVYRLTNGSVFACDTTNASRTLLYDIGALAWDEELCELWETPIEALPEVRDSSARFGETTFGGVFETPLPICGVMGDSQAALFAQGCYEVGSAKVTFGTGSSLLLNIGSEMIPPKQGLVTTLAWTLDGVPTYAMEGIIISSAATLSWLKDQLGLFSEIGEVEAIARELEDNGGVYLVPAFTGLGLPYWRGDARATIVGLSSHSDRRHIIRAGLESIAYQVHDALVSMRSASGVSLKGVNADGGPTANRFLMQMVADVCDLEISVASVAECSPLGATLAGMVGMGDLADPKSLLHAATKPPVFVPSMSSEERTRMLSGWTTAVRQTIGEVASLPVQAESEERLPPIERPSVQV